MQSIFARHCLFTRLRPPSPGEAALALALLPVLLFVCVALIIVWPLCRMGAWYEGWCPDCLSPIVECRCQPGEGKSRWKRAKRSNWIVLTKIALGFAPPRSIKDAKGGDILEWPADMRVREFPDVAYA